MSNTQLGYIMAAATACGLVFAYLISILANKLNRKHMVLGGLALIGIGVASTGLAHNFKELLFGRFIAGIGSTILIIVTPLFVTSYFEQKTMGRAMAIFTAAQPLGIIIGLNTFGQVAAHVGWRNTMFVITGIEAVVFLLCMFFLTLPRKSVAAETHSIKGGAKNLSMVLLVVIYGVFTLGVSAYVNFAPTYFGMNGTPPALIGLLSSFIMIVPLVTAPFVGIILDTVAKNHKKAFLIFSSVAMAAAYVAIGSHYMNTFIPWAILLGLGFAFVAPICYSAMPEMVSEKNLSIGMGLLIISFDIGGAGAAVLFGMVLDAAGGVYSVAFNVIAGLILCLVPLILFLKLRRTSQEIVIPANYARELR